MLHLLQANYLTKSKGVTGEVISALAPNKKATVAFTDKQVRDPAWYFSWINFGFVVSGKKLEKP